MSNDDLNSYLPSILNPRCVKKIIGDITLTQNSVVSRCSLSLRKNNSLSDFQRKNKTFPIDKENVQDKNNSMTKQKVLKDQIKLSSVEGIHTTNNNLNNNYDLSRCEFGATDLHKCDKIVKDYDNSAISVSSATELNDECLDQSNSTVIYDATDKPLISVSFEVKNCESLDISTNHSKLKRVLVSHNNNDITLDCEVIEGSQIPMYSELDENINEASSPQKRSAVAVNLDIKKKKLSSLVDAAENDRVLILNTNAIEKLSHVIVQPPNYKLVKQNCLDKSKFKSSIRKRKSFFRSSIKIGNTTVHGDNLKQKSIESYLIKYNNNNNFVKVTDERTLVDYRVGNVVRDEAQEMSKNSGGAGVKCDRIGRACYKTNRKENEVSPKSARVSISRRENDSPRQQDIKTSSSDAPRVPSPRGRNDSLSSHSPRKNVESIQFSLASKSKSNKTSATRNIPHYKIVAGTHFAVDAFSYGEIPNVKYYFLTHFHSDHYSGLKRTFNKLLFCSQITADLCVSRLGVNAKCINVMTLDATIRVEGVEVTAVDANHCPGAIMLVFTLPNGKTILHTGDFRASPVMESYPIFWNKEIHTIYLDTTYCNPRYDFPTQDQSLEMALYLLRQKKTLLEQAGKKFSSVLIVCGTYTIGKEKFFLGMARRVGCSVWACPEKDRVLQAVEGRSFSHAPPHSCQLHVVPMRDLTLEKLRSYLDSLQGAFSEVVAFKPSGWENGKNSTVEKDMVTIHGIPYSEHSSFSEMIRFVKYLKPKQVVPTVDISGGVRAVQKYFPCPLVHKEDIQCQSRVTDFFSIQRQQVPAVT